MSRLKFVLPFLIIPLLLSGPFFTALGDLGGSPTFLGVWSQLKASNRVIDTGIITGNLTMNLNITNAHLGGLTGINGFDITLNYNPAVILAKAAGISSTKISATAPTGAVLEPICPSLTGGPAGCIFDPLALAGRTLVAFRVELDCTFNPTLGTCPATPGRSRVFVGLAPPGPNAAPNGVALSFRFSVIGTGSSDITIDPASAITVGSGQLISYIKVDGFFQNIAGGTDYKLSLSPNRASVSPTQSATSTIGVSLGSCTPSPCAAPGFVTLTARDLSDPPPGTPLRSDPRIKFVGPGTTWVPGNTVVYDTNNNNMYDAGEPVLSGAPPAVGTALKFDPKIVVADADGNLVWDPGEAVVYDSNGNFAYDESPLPGEPVIAGTVGLSLGTPSGTPPFTSTLTITTNIYTVRNDVGVLGNHTIIVNATSTSIPKGVLTTFLLTVQFPPINFAASLNRNVITLRPGENSPDVRFIDNNGNGVYDPGVDTLVLDTDVNSLPPIPFAEVSDVVVSVTPARQVAPFVRFWDSDLSGVYSIDPTTRIGKTLVFDADNNGFIDSADMIVSVSPARAPNSTELGLTPAVNGLICGGAQKGTGSLGCPLMDVLQQSILFIPHTGSNGIYAPGVDTLVLKGDKIFGTVTSLDSVVSVTPTTSASAQVGLPLLGEMGKPLIRVNEVGQLVLSEPRIRSIGPYSPGVTLVFDADNNGIVDAADTVVSVTPTRAPLAAEMNQVLSLVPNVKFIDLRGNGIYASSLLGGPPDTLVFDATQDGVVDSGDTVVSVTPTRIPKPRMMFIANATGQDINRYNVGETLVYDADLNGLVDPSDTIVSVTPTRAPNSTELASPTRLMTVEIVVTVTWMSGGPETVDLVASQPKPLDGTIKIEVEHASGVVSGSVVAGVQTSTLVSAISFRTVNSSGPASLTGTYLPIKFEIGLTARSRLSSISKAMTGSAAPILVMSKLGYRWDLAFDYKVSFTPPAPDASGNNVKLSKSQVFTLTQQVSVNVTQGIPGNILLTSQAMALGTSITEPSINIRFSFNFPVPNATQFIPGFCTCSFNTSITLTIGTLLKVDPKIRFIGPGTTWAAGNTVVYNTAGNGQYNAGEPVIAGTAPAVGTLLKSDPRLAYVDTDNNNVWDPGETVTYDTNLNGIYDGGPPLMQFAEPVIGCGCPTVIAPRVTPSGGYTIASTASPAGATPAQELITSYKLCVFFQGDVNHDGVVNFLDLGLIGAAFLSTPTSANWNPAADVNKDGTVNFLDLGIIGSQFLQHC